jgi:hypothetical protein
MVLLAGMGKPLLSLSRRDNVADFGRGLLWGVLECRQVRTQDGLGRKDDMVA